MAGREPNRPSLGFSTVGPSLGLTLGLTGLGSDPKRSSLGFFVGGGTSSLSFAFFNRAEASASSALLNIGATRVYDSYERTFWRQKNKATMPRKRRREGDTKAKENETTDDSVKDLNEVASEIQKQLKKEKWNSAADVEEAFHMSRLQTKFTTTCR